MSIVLRIFFSISSKSSVVDSYPKFFSILFTSTPPNPSKLDVILISAKGRRLNKSKDFFSDWNLSRRKIEENRTAGLHRRKLVTLISRSTKVARLSGTVITLWKAMLDEVDENVREGVKTPSHGKSPLGVYPPPGPPRTQFFGKVNEEKLTEKGGTPPPLTDQKSKKNSPQRHFFGVFYPKKTLFLGQKVNGKS